MKYFNEINISKNNKKNERIKKIMKELIFNTVVLVIIVSIIYYTNRDVEKTFMYLGGSFLTSSFVRLPFNRIINILYKYIPPYLICSDKYFLYDAKYAIYKSYSHMLGKNQKSIMELLFKSIFDLLNDDDNVLRLQTRTERLEYYLLFFDKYIKNTYNNSQSEILDILFDQLDTIIVRNCIEQIDKFKSIVESFLIIIENSNKLPEYQRDVMNKYIILYGKQISNNSWTIDKYLYTEYLYYIIEVFNKINEENYQEKYINYIIKKINIESKKAYYSEENFNLSKTSINMLLVIYKDTDIQIDKIENIIYNMDIFLNSYDDELKKIIKNKVLIPFIGSIYSNKFSEISPIFLHGSAGVGKTKFVQEISRILDSHLYYEQDSSNINNKNDIDINMYTNAIYNAKLQNKKSCIIFIDEFDKFFHQNSGHVVSKYLKLLNTDTIYIDDEIILPKFHMLIFASGNKLLNNISTDLLPLQNRFITITFPKITKELKKKIIYSKFNIIKEDSIINNIINNNDDDGIRTLLIEISKILEIRKMNNLFNNTCWKYEYNESDD